MSNSWISNAGVEIRDLVPSVLRREWVERGQCPGRDLYSLFSRQVWLNPERDAVIDSAGVLDYADLDTQVRRIAAELNASGLGSRDVVAIRLPNGRDAVAAELAVAAIGAVALPYPTGGGSRDTRSLLGRSRASALILAGTAEEDSAELRAGLPYLREVFTFGSGGKGCRSIHASSPGASVDRWAPTAVSPEAPARILVSSGSENEPKMVAYSHNAMGGGRASYVRALHDGNGPMRNLVLVPLSSSFGSCGTSVTIAALGGTLLLTEAFDPPAALRMITQYRPTHLFGVPTMLRRMADQRPESNEDISSLRAVVASGALLPDATAEACLRRFRRAVISVYGSSDGVNCHTVVTGPGSDTGTGLPDPAVARIRVMDSGGNEVPAGEPGEICALGPMSPLSYVAAPELDARYRSAGGWVRTGDRGLLDRHGRLHVLGRLKQIVVRGGCNISPAEVEQELGAHPDIAEVACVPVPDADLGERLCACVTRKPDTGAMTLEGVVAFLESARGLERRKLPEYLLELPEFPLGSTGKVCRRTLTALATERGSPTQQGERAKTAPPTEKQGHNHAVQLGKDPQDTER